jgi:hypothetical protein
LISAIESAPFWQLDLVVDVDWKGVLVLIIGEIAHAGRLYHNHLRFDLTKLIGLR